MKRIRQMINRNPNRYEFLFVIVFDFFIFVFSYLQKQKSVRFVSLVEGKTTNNFIDLFDFIGNNFSTDDNDPIVYCDRCGVIVHESCYNADTLDDKSSDSSSPSEYWFCTPCLAHIDDPVKQNKTKNFID